MLSLIHNMKIWLEGRLIKINKAIIHLVTGYPTLDRPKMIKISIRDVVKPKKKGRMEQSWNANQDRVIEFAACVVAHKFYQSSRLNNIPWNVWGPTLIHHNTSDTYLFWHIMNRYVETLLDGLDIIILFYVMWCFALKCVIMLFDIL